MDNGVEAYDELVKKQVIFVSHPYLKKSRDDVETLLKPKDSPKMAFIGQQYTDLEMTDPDGKMHKIILIDPQGKIIDRALHGKALHTRLQDLIGE